MNQINHDEKIVQEFKKRKKKQILISIPVILIMILLAVMSTNPELKDKQISPDVFIFGIPSYFIAIGLGIIFLAILVFSFLNWRCPACNSYLGKAVNPKFCGACGSKLQYSKMDRMQNHSIKKNIKKSEPISESMEKVDSDDIENYIQDLKCSQNLPMAILGGFVATVISSILWAYITVSIDRQIGWMAIGVGLLVGYVVRLFGKGIDTRFGVIGAAFSLLGCVMGNLLTVCMLIAQQENMPVMELFSYLNAGVILQLIIDTFSPMDLLFYAIATYEGYKFSFRIIDEE